MSIYSDLADNVRPPRKDGGFVLTISTTARSYDLQGMKFGQEIVSDVNPARVYLRLHAIIADVWVQFAPTSAITLDKTYAQAEGTTGTAIDATAASMAKVGELIEAGQFRDFTLHRARDKFMSVQGSAAGTLEGRCSSEPFGKQQ